MTQSRIELLSAAKSAINAASFAPTEQRINEAKAALTELFNYVESLTPKASPDKLVKAERTTPEDYLKAKQQRAEDYLKAKQQRAEEYIAAKQQRAEDYIEAKQQRESRGIATVFTSPEAKPERKAAKQQPIDKPSLSDYHSIEDATRDIRSRKAAEAAAKAEIEYDITFGAIDLDIDLSDVPF